MQLLRAALVQLAAKQTQGAPVSSAHRMAPAWQDTGSMRRTVMATTLVWAMEPRVTLEEQGALPEPVPAARDLGLDARHDVMTATIPIVELDICDAMNTPRLVLGQFVASRFKLQASRAFEGCLRSVLRKKELSSALEKSIVSRPQ
jgi:hypothetical protein